MFNFLSFFRNNNRQSRNMIYNLINFETARSMINNPENVLIDVRSRKEYDIMHIQNAICIPIDKLRICENEYRNKRNIIIYCSSGMRTKEAINILNSMGYTNLCIWEYGALSNFPFKDMLVM